MSAAIEESIIEDALDRAIIRALQVAPRAPFRLVADVLGTSEQTIARHYRRLHRSGVLRVTAVLNQAAFGLSNWIVRVQCKPSGALSLAQALARRDDVGWVSLGSGGSEVLCVVRARTEQARDELIMQRLPRTAPVLGMTVAVVLHRFIGDGFDDWTGLADVLTAAQQARLREQAPGVERTLRTPGGASTTPPQLSDADVAMLDVLVRDGRAPYSSLAAAAGISEGRAARRLQELLRQGIAYLDVDLAAGALGFRTQAYLWLAVSPAELANAGNALRAEPEVAFVAAISGAHNLTAAVMCRDLEALYEFVTTKIGAIAGVQSVEVAPSMHHVKQAGALMVGDRLVVD